jgi:hypothetical protein
MRLPIILGIALFLTGCALPWPVTVLSTGMDIIIKKETGKTPLEHGISELTQTDCDFTRVIDGVFPCMSDEEYVDYLLDMDCETYTWDNVLQIPKCKKTLDKQ